MWTGLRGAGQFNSKKDSLFFDLLVFVEKLSCAFANHVIIVNDIWGKRLVQRSVPKNKLGILILSDQPC